MSKFLLSDDGFDVALNPFQLRVSQASTTDAIATECKVEKGASLAEQ